MQNASEKPVVSQSAIWSECHNQTFESWMVLNKKITKRNRTKPKKKT